MIMIPVTSPGHGEWSPVGPGRAVTRGPARPWARPAGRRVQVTSHAGSTRRRVTAALELGN